MRKTVTDLLSPVLDMATSASAEEAGAPAKNSKRGIIMQVRTKNAGGSREVDVGAASIISKKAHFSDIGRPPKRFNIPRQGAGILKLLRKMFDHA